MHFFAGKDLRRNLIRLDPFLVQLESFLDGGASADIARRLFLVVDAPRDLGESAADVIGGGDEVPAQLGDHLAAQLRLRVGGGRGWRFGNGIVEACEGADKVVARFKGFGPKKVMLEYLTLQK